MKNCTKELPIEAVKKALHRDRISLERISADRPKLKRRQRLKPKHRLRERIGARLEYLREREEAEASK
jgi:hypothetical protein